MSEKRVLIIGASAAGMSAAAAVREADENASVSLFTDEAYPPYYRPYLTEYLSNAEVEKKSTFFLKTGEWFAKKKISLKLNEKIIELIPGENKVVSAEGKSYAYDRLILANGSSPFVPFPEALRKENVFAVRTLDDAKRIYSCASGCRRAVVIGGGLLGLETAYSLKKLGLDVVIIEVGDRILPRQLDHDGAGILEGIIKAHGVDLYFNRKIFSIEGESRADGLVFSDGDEISGDLFVFSIGVRPNITLAQSAGIKVNKAVVVDDKMETSIPGIYACGDVSECCGTVMPIWMPAVKQGKVAGLNAAGKTAGYVTEEYPTTFNAFETRIFSIGRIELLEGVRAHRTRDEKCYKKLFFRDDVLAGFILLGDFRDSQSLLQALKTRKSYGDVVNPNA